ncbi:hypothetical protein J6590_092031 [Homalodisca vitripennis]|nr:hypothetical protein J6590_092031 [Homalodisca vitripennis]
MNADSSCVTTTPWWDIHGDFEASHNCVILHIPGSAARDPHGIKQITVGPPHGIKQITMFIRENVECLDSSFTTTTTIKVNNCTLIFHYRKL